MTFILQDADMSLLPPPVSNEEPSEWIWPRIFLFFLSWWAYYWCILRFTKRDAEYCCRTVTLTHGTIIIYLTLKDIIINKQEFDYWCTTPLTAYQIYFLSFTFSYFLYDLVWINVFGTEPLTIHLHHICSLLLLGKIIVSDTGGPGISYGLLGLEFTNPYLQTRWFLRTHGYHNKLIHKIVELWFIFTFIFIRIFGGTTLLYYVEIHPNMDISLKIAFIGIYVVSWLLIAQIAQFFKKKYLSRTHSLLTSSVLSIFPYRRGNRSQPSPTNPPDQDDG